MDGVREFVGGEYFSYLIGMEVEFRTTSDDYVAFYRYFFFQRKLTVRIVYWTLLSLLIGGLFYPYLPNWGYVLIVLGILLAVALFLFVIPYQAAIRRLRKALAASANVNQLRRMVLTAGGFSLQWPGEGMESQPIEHYRMESIKAVEENDRYVFILQYHRFPLVIPKSFFSANDAISNFIGMIGYRRMRSAGREPDRIKSEKIVYWGLLGIIPVLGGIAGIVLLILGILYKSSKLIIVGAIDILLAIIFWVVFVSYLFHWVFNTHPFHDMQKQFTKEELNTAFKDVEFYKLQHGHYPDSLQEVEPFRQRELFYQKLGDKYWLFAVGEDKQPFTADDIYPTMNPADSTKFGLRLR